MKKLFPLLILFAFALSSKSQIRDSIYYDTSITTLRLSPRLALNIQKGFGVEAGFMLDHYFVGINHGNKFNQMVYSLHGFYISSEFNFPSFNKIIIAPKIGWEYGVIAPTNGSHLGTEIIYYTDSKNSVNNSFACLIKIGIPLGLVNIAYGFTMFFDGKMKSQIGKHQLTIDYILDWKAKKANRKISQRYKRLNNKEH